MIFLADLIPDITGEALTEFLNEGMVRDVWVFCYWMFSLVLVVVVVCFLYKVWRRVLRVMSGAEAARKSYFSRGGHYRQMMRSDIRAGYGNRHNRRRDRD